MIDRARVDYVHPLIRQLIEVGQALRPQVVRQPLRGRHASPLGVDELVAGHWLAFWPDGHGPGKASSAFPAEGDETVAARRRASGLSVPGEPDFRRGQIAVRFGQSHKRIFGGDQHERGVHV